MYIIHASAHIHNYIHTHSLFLPAGVTTTMFSLVAFSTAAFKVSDLLPTRGMASTDLRPVIFTSFITYCMAITTFLTDVSK